MEWYVVGTFMIVSMLVLLFLGVPAAFALGLSAAVTTVLFVGAPKLILLANVTFDNMSQHAFIVVPLFILMAALVTSSGLGKRSYEAAARWLNRLPGSLAVASVFASAGFAAVSGSSVATVVTVGSIAIPEMLRKGYDKRLAIGAVASAGSLGILIPPAIALVVFGIITETSVGQLFIAGIVPGLVTAVILALYILALVWLKPELAPSAGRFTWRERFSSLGGVWPIVALFVAVMGAIYFGIATPAEAAGVGAGGALLLVIAQRQLTFNHLADSLAHSARTTAMLMFLVVGGFMFSIVAALTGVAHGIADALLNSGLSPTAVMIAYMVLLIVLGTAMESATIIVITMPILFPAFKAMGFDPLWLGIITSINAEIATISPPAGLVLFAMRGITPPEVTDADIQLAMLPFCGVLSLALILVMVFPDLATWLPRTMAGR